jgi:hypothetical protein
MPNRICLREKRYITIEPSHNKKSYQSYSLSTLIHIKTTDQTNMTTSYDLPSLLAADMNTLIDPVTVNQVLTSPPFISLPGALNIRDLGLLPGSPIPPGLLYRSGAIHSIPPSSLSTLGIKAIFGLRSKSECEMQPNPEVEGVENFWFSPTRNPSSRDMHAFIENGGTSAYTAMYLEILDIHAPSIKAVLEWLKDGKGAMLFHCTGTLYLFFHFFSLYSYVTHPDHKLIAGKDRTGVLAALLLSLAGASKEVIAHDYALTRIGVEPSRDMLLQMLKLWNKEWTAETPGMQEFVQVRGEFILAFLEEVEGKFGGVEGWVRNVLGFSKDDVERVREVLTGGVQAS